VVQDTPLSFPYSILISKYEVKDLLFCLIIFLSLLPRSRFNFCTCLHDQNERLMSAWSRTYLYNTELNFIDMTGKV